MSSLPLSATAALRPRLPAHRLPRAPLAASLAAHAGAAALIVLGARHALIPAASPPLATFEMIVAPHATGSGTAPPARPAVRPTAAHAPSPAAPPRPAPPPPRAPAPSAPRPSPATVSLSIPAPAPPAAEINLGGLGFVEGHGIVPPAADAAWHNQPPDFPLEAQVRGEHGTVEVLIHVSADGRAVGADMIQSSGWPLLDRAVLDAVPLWRFRPGERNGAPVASVLPFRVVFSRGRR